MSFPGPGGEGGGDHRPPNGFVCPMGASTPRPVPSRSSATLMVHRAAMALPPVFFRPSTIGVRLSSPPSGPQPDAPPVAYLYLPKEEARKKLLVPAAPVFSEPPSAAGLDVQKTPFVSETALVPPGAAEAAALDLAPICNKLLARSVRLGLGTVKNKIKKVSGELCIETSHRQASIPMGQLPRPIDEKGARRTSFLYFWDKHKYKVNYGSSPCLQIRKASDGVRNETNHRQAPLPMSQILDPVDENGTRTSFLYFWDKHNYKLNCGSWPCLQVGSDSRYICLPKEVNICFCDLKIPMPINAGNVLELVHTALLKRNIKCHDFYLLLHGRTLDGDVETMSIPGIEEFNIYVFPRMRGGRIENNLVRDESLDAIINNSNQLTRHIHLEKGPRYPLLPPHHHHVPVLLNFSQWAMYHLLVCICRWGHQEGKSWNGAFSLSDVLVGDGHIIISPVVPAQNYTPEGGRADYNQLYKIVLQFVDRRTRRLPTHMDFFLKTLRQADDSMMRNPTFITFLINHPCLLSFAERNRLYCLVDQMIHKLDVVYQEVVFDLLEAAAVDAGCTGWNASVVCVLKFNDTYMFGAEVNQDGVLVSKYNDLLASGFHLCPNFLNHSSKSVNLQSGEIALSYFMDYTLALVLETLLLDFNGPVG